MHISETLSKIANATEASKGSRFVHKLFLRRRLLFSGFVKAIQPIPALALGALFLCAGVVKAVRPSSFASALRYHYDFPLALSISAAVVVPLLEIAVGICLVLSVYMLFARFVARVLVIAFLVFHLTSFLRGMDAACHCFGDSVQLTDVSSFLIVMCMAVVAFIPQFLRVQSEGTKIRKDLTRRRIFVSLALFPVAAAIFFTRYVRINEEFTSGMVNRTNLDAVRSKVERIFQSYVQKSSKPTLILLMRSPACSPCLSELTFWNAAENSSLADILAFVPSSDSDVDVQALYKRYRIRFPVHVIDASLHAEVIGRYPRFVARLVFSSTGELLFANTGGQDDADRTAFKKRLREPILQREGARK